MVFAQLHVALPKVTLLLATEDEDVTDKDSGLLVEAAGTQRLGQADGGRGGGGIRVVLCCAVILIGFETRTFFKNCMYE